MIKLIKPVVFVIALIPFIILLVRIFQNDLGPDPVQELSLETGEWTLQFLILAIAMTPLRRITNRIEFVRHRRMIGLFALFYATLHLAVWLTFLLEFRWLAILEEVIERPYITVGFSSYLILLALGLTSPKFMLRKLGKNWKRLHKLVYVAAVLGVLHLLWILRLDIGSAVFYGSLVAVLLGYRLWFYLRAGFRSRKRTKTA
ncbi:MAG: sulfoxide reductase heme-binding subunit YedZ [SAR86 cluster bacterium]|uniref:Protein-methionine-sulfoxide reductase heme-binding subunit MsrQ n=1 Tax=SAR86 cluster bacterium TaxID=2030880 RepID=A0A2A5AEP5_9GAMM|nr:MAG: sulfoxide reductase heme-binding subunit YedZ [SAR86 cluster bacterium]